MLPVLLFALTGLSACAGDACREACGDLARKQDSCLPAWGLEWPDLGARSRAAWRETCEDQWEQTRAELETRQLAGAEDACEDASVWVEEATCAEIYRTLGIGK